MKSEHVQSECIMDVVSRVQYAAVCVQCNRINTF
jgi:hypothetical protein